MQHLQYQKVAVLAIFQSIVIVSVNFHVSYAQTVCNMSTEDLLACKPAATPPRPPPPSARCCSALSHADIRCLCSYRNSKLVPSLGIDPRLAEQIPAKCRLPHPAHC